MVKNPPAMQDTQVQSLRGEDSMEKEMVTHSSVFAWEISWTEPWESQRVGQDLETKQQQKAIKIIKPVS